MIKNDDFIIKNLGERAYPSPLPLSHSNDDLVSNFINDDERFLHEI